MNKKLRIAIFDLTDCEGCELEFLALKEKLIKIGDQVEITNWRLATSAGSEGPFGATFIEGSPITETDIEVIKRARAVSKNIITLGTCAVHGGLQSAIPEKERTAALKEIYGPNYRTKSKAPKPVDYYINVDVHLPGCPINKEELEKLLSCLLAGKDFKGATAPVCLDCKASKTACLFIEDGFCLGPVTRGGCGAPCPQKGLRCYGCFGPMPQANLLALKKAAPAKLTEGELDKSLALYFSHANEYKDYDIKTKGVKSDRKRS